MGIARVDGQLSLSRAIGDRYMKPSGVVAEPEMYVVPAGGVQYALLACDGLFDVFTVDEVDDAVRTMIAGKVVNNHKTRPQILEAALQYVRGQQAQADQLMQQIGGQRVYRTAACQDVDPGAPLARRVAQTLTKMAYWRNSMDNVTVCVGVPE